MMKQILYSLILGYSPLEVKKEPHFFDPNEEVGCDVSRVGHCIRVDELDRIGSLSELDLEAVFLGPVLIEGHVVILQDEHLVGGCPLGLVINLSA